MASAAAAVQAPVAASDVDAGASAAGASATGASAAAPVQAPIQAPVQFPVDWDPYKQEPYVAPENPYDISIVDDDKLSGSDVGSGEEDEHTKARQVLRRLQVGQYASSFANGVYKCLFCNRRLRGTDFNCLLTHPEDIGRTSPKVAMMVNVHAFRAKHKVLDIRLRNFQRVEIAVGRMPPIKPKVPKIRGQGRKK